MTLAERTPARAEPSSTAAETAAAGPRPPPSPTKPRPNGPRPISIMARNKTSRACRNGDLRHGHRNGDVAALAVMPMSIVATVKNGLA